MRGLMSMLCYTGFWVRMGRDYCGASLLPQANSDLETDICRDLAFLSQQHRVCLPYILFLSLRNMKFHI